jgi:Ser/Thr protein kinase RdoA (MazF antagonist)
MAQAYGSGSATYRSARSIVVKGNALSDLPYSNLSPDLVLEALETVGVRCDGRILALNSYENRVYQLGLDDGGFVVTKFYRPGRWSDEAIQEEHDFAAELVDQEIPVVAPLVIDGATLHEHSEYRFAVFPRQGGRWPELGSREDRLWMGRFVGRLHAVGAVNSFEHRLALSTERMGDDSADYLLASDWIPYHLEESYETIVEQLLETVADCFMRAGEYRELRIHGDCHPGNVLWTGDGPHFVDLDDCITGPAVQDLWLFLSGERDERAGQLQDLLEGYGQFFEFDYRQLHLIEALRTLRMIHYTAWIARRWVDPAFPRAFPWFAENKYWEEHVLALKEQAAVMNEPPLEVV